MCGRITQDLNLKMLFDRYRLSAASPALNLKARCNGCPTQDFVAVRREGEERRLAELRWGLVPGWAKDLKMGARMINARSETVHEKPAFRMAFRRRRCVVPVNAWFEWRRKDGEKQPYWIRPAGAEAFSLARISHQGGRHGIRIHVKGNEFRTLPIIKERIPCTHSVIRPI